jgi:methylmalonyl-CoA epimerase
LIEIVTIDHISMAVPDREEQVELLERLFGFRRAGTFENEEGYVGTNLVVPGGSDVGWEVLEPNGPDSYLHRFLESPHGPGLHHVTIQVRSVGDAAEVLRANGIEPWGYHEREGEHDRGVLYIHPRRGGNGFLYQLYAGEPWSEEEPFEDDGEHTLGIIAVNHLAHAHLDRDELAEWYERILGCETVYRSPAAEVERAFQTRVVEMPTRQMRFEMISPAGEDSFIAAFLDRRDGPSMHHVTFEVGDWDRAVQACAYHEVPIFGERRGETDGAEWREAFIHPKHTGGALVQFFWQAEPGIWI